MIKNLIVLTVLSFFINATATSQNIKFGAKGGMNISKYGGNSNAPFTKYTGNVGFHIGGIVEIPMMEKFSIQPELLYSLQGTKINSGERVIRLNTLQLPILAKYYIVNGLSAEAGPVLGYLLSAKYEAEFNSIDGREVKDITDSYKPIDVALALGASYKLKSDLFFGLRYNFGLTDLQDSGINGSKIKHNVLQVSAGYFF